MVRRYSPDRELLAGVDVDSPPGSSCRGVRVVGVSGPGRTDVLCIGETMALLTPDPPAPLSQAQQLMLSCAGAESNVAAWLAGLGSAAQWCGRVGADPLGQRVIAELQGHGVGVVSAVIDPTAATAVFFKDPAAGGTTVWYYRMGSAGSRLAVSDVDRALDLQPTILHLSGITPALSDSCAAAVRYAVRAARKRDILISFDVNYRPVLWNDGAAAAVLAELAALADLVFVGRDEAAALWGTTTVLSVAHRLPHVRTLIVKDGSDSATSFTDGHLVRVPALAVEVREPVGAGDAFAAGYLRGRLLDLGPEVCLRLGHLVAIRALGSATDVGSLPVLPGELESLAMSGTPW